MSSWSNTPFSIEPSIKQSFLSSEDWKICCITLSNLFKITFKKNPFCCKMTNLIWFISCGLRGNMGRLGVEAREQMCQQEADTPCILSLQLPGLALQCVSLQFVKLWRKEPFICQWVWCLFCLRYLCGAYIHLYFWSAQENLENSLLIISNCERLFMNFKCQVPGKRSLLWEVYSCYLSPLWIML